MGARLSVGGYDNDEHKRNSVFEHTSEAMFPVSSEIRDHFYNVCHAFDMEGIQRKLHKTK